jgi:hypothetical protein
MDAIVIPIREPLTFGRLRELNPHATAEELAEAFPHLPTELREQAWEAARLRMQLDEWNGLAREGSQ